MMRHTTFRSIPAKAGTHRSTVRVAEAWAPAFAGMGFGMLAP
jgi:hypothetical protein